MLDAHILEWVNLAIRWTHIIAGIAWIGSSFFFMWLDSHLEKGAEPKPDIEGELWMVHSGGFYQVEKYMIAPPTMPKTLHWFKWEAAATWISGIALLVVAYYLAGAAFLVDPQSQMPAWGAMTVGIAAIIASWFVYDAIYRSPLGRNGAVAAPISFALLVVVAYLMSLVFTGRAAYIHVGAIMGTIMAANVWSVIIPAQRQLVDATLAGRQRDPKAGPRAKQRSVHNNYMTLPVVFIMVSSHYPSTYGHPFNWLVLIGIVVVGAVVRHYFNLRNAGAGFKGWTWGVGVAGMAALIAFTAPGMMARRGDAASAPDAAPVTFARVQEIVTARCATCHSARPTDRSVVAAPGGVMFDTADQIKAHAAAIHRMAVASRAMPLANKTGMTGEERALLGRWIDTMDDAADEAADDAMDNAMDNATDNEKATSNE